MSTASETVIDPERPIIDPHLHLWDIREAEGSRQEPQTFLLADAVRTIGESGHRITHSVYLEAHAMYRADGPSELRSLGETEFANGMAAMSASGNYGPVRIAHRIVANVDLSLGARTAELLERHRAVAGDRLRGVRLNVADTPAGLFGSPPRGVTGGWADEPRLIEGCRRLAAMGLSLDVWCMHPQLDDLTRLVDRVPELEIVLDHLGTPDLRGILAGREREALAQWCAAIARLAERPNVRIKISGLGMDLARPIPVMVGSDTSADLADRWAPFIQQCIEAFTPARAMFASNFPPDQAAASYGAVWNAFKRATKSLGDADKDWLFRRTAAETYAIELDGPDDG